MHGYTCYCSIVAWYCLILLFGSFVPLEYTSGFGITGHLYIGSLIAVDIATKSHDQDGFDFFCDCRGEMCDMEKKPFDYRTRLTGDTKYHNTVVNRLNVKTRGNTFKHHGELENTMTAVIQDLARSKKALLHCIHGASRSAFLALLFMVGMCPNLPLESAVDFLRAARPCLDVNGQRGHANIDEAVQYYMRRFKALCDQFGLTGTLADPVDFEEAKMALQECVQNNRPSLVGDPQPPLSSAPAPKPRPTCKPSGASGSSASSGSAATNNCARAQDGRAPVAPVTDPKPSGSSGASAIPQPVIPYTWVGGDGVGEVPALDHHDASKEDEMDMRRVVKNWGTGWFIRDAEPKGPQFQPYDVVDRLPMFQRLDRPSLIQSASRLQLMLRTCRDLGAFDDFIAILKADNKDGMKKKFQMDYHRDGIIGSYDGKQGGDMQQSYYCRMKLKDYGDCFMENIYQEKCARWLRLAPNMLPADLAWQVERWSGHGYADFAEMASLYMHEKTLELYMQV